ncbi:hypothetical protein [Rhodococcus globerulus]|uniref:Uncharacterized protein n=1 Tax=Rhodococcus globerulus TaxID=33008 RepID=A0ABU4BS59_RHOGO|nr:hypothetical protein [Rhodococcus globerulus]MDV6267059.1 hypothetical protein [Rhodococcus globerulus]
MSERWTIRKKRIGWVARPPWGSCVNMTARAREFGPLLMVVTELARREAAGEDKHSLREDLRYFQVKEDLLAEEERQIVEARRP